MGSFGEFAVLFCSFAFVTSRLVVGEVRIISRGLQMSQVFVTLASGFGFGFLVRHIGLRSRSPREVPGSVVSPSLTLLTSFGTERAWRSAVCLKIACRAWLVMVRGDVLRLPSSSLKQARPPYSLEVIKI